MSQRGFRQPLAAATATAWHCSTASRVRNGMCCATGFAASRCAARSALAVCGASVCQPTGCPSPTKTAFSEGSHRTRPPPAAGCPQPCQQCSHIAASGLQHLAAPRGRQAAAGSVTRTTLLAMLSYKRQPPQRCHSYCTPTFADASKQMCRLAPVPLTRSSFDIHYNEHHATFTDNGITPEMVLQQQGSDGIRLAANDGMYLYGQYQVTAKVAGASGVVTAFYVSAAALSLV
eukprot:GHRQ01025580.1.p1 GENE.GHRQ01025580.1~~GHRQ01025580.1.p1  ORF type:complete len:232 (-),score=14.00 GHRQ01025580.1:279-974(-)